MLDIRHSQPKHLMAAIPAAAFAGALALVLGMGANEPLTEFLLALPTAVFVALYVLPFALIGGLAYYPLKRFRLLSPASCALVGLAIGLGVAAIQPTEPMWFALCAVVGVVSALAGYFVLWLLARSAAP